MLIKNGSKLLASCAMVALLPTALQAAEEEKKTSSVLFEELVVTAQKREQSAQDVGIAITALSGSQMKALGYTNAQEVTALAPGVGTIQPNGEANYAVSIRGVANSDFTTNVESPVAIYVDETYISQTSGAGFMLFDMERVEVLRGPQGTLFGRNATGGLIHFISVKPEVGGDLNGYGSISYGRFNRIKAEGAVGLPINDVLAARVSFSTNQGDGYITNRLNPDQKLNNTNETALRLQLMYEPNDEVSLLLNARYGQQDIRTGFFEYESAQFPTGEATPGLPNPFLDNYSDNDGDVYAGDYDRTGRNDLETYGFTGTLNWETSAGTVTSITDYYAVTRNYIEDSDASPANYFNFFLTTDSKQFSQELRLNGEADNLRYVAGFFYLNIDINDSNGGIAPGLFDGAELTNAFGPDPANGIISPYTIDTKSWSLFGQLEYDLTEDLTLIGGLRYISEDKDFVYQNIFSFFPETAVSGLDPNRMDIFESVNFTNSRDDGEWSARVQLDYQAMENLLVYASWNRGVKSGGFNAPFLPTPEFATPPFLNFGPEKLDAYEVGFKWDSEDGLLRVNGSVYYYDYKDCQAFSIINLDTFTLNSECESKGAELEIQASPADGLDMMFGIGYTDAEVSNVPGLTIPIGTPLGTVDPILPGATVRPVQTPEWNLNGLIRYETEIGNAGSIAFQIDGQYRSEHFFALTNAPAVTEDGYFLANASVTYYSPNDDWNLQFLIQNITDEEYLVQTFDLSGNLAEGGLFGLIEQYYGRPLQWTVKLNFDF